MNEIALRYLIIVLSIAALTLLVTLLFKREFTSKIRQVVSWLLKVSYFDFVHLIIFIRPLKKFTVQTGTVIWIILVLVIGNYLIFTQPELSEIPGPYIPMIGYVFFISILFIMHFTFLISRRDG